MTSGPRTSQNKENDHMDGQDLRTAYYAAVDDYVQHLADSIRRTYPGLAAALDAYPGTAAPEAVAKLSVLSGWIVAGVHRTGEFDRRLDGVGSVLDGIVSVLDFRAVRQGDLGEVLHETCGLHRENVNPYVSRPSPFRCTSDHGDPDIAKAHALSSDRHATEGV